MTPEQAVSRYVDEILRVVRMRAALETEAVRRVRACATAQGCNPAVVEIAAELTASKVRGYLWHGSRL